MEDFTTDADKMAEAAVHLDEGADVAEANLPIFEEGSFIPSDAYAGNMAFNVPPQWNVAQKLAEFMEGPYTTARSFMVATLSRTAVVMRANATEMTEAAKHYKAQELENETRFRMFGE